MPWVTEKTAQLIRRPAHLAGQVSLPLTQMRGHRIPGECSNNGVGSGGPDNSGAKNGESGDHHSQPGAAGANNLPFAAGCEPLRGTTGSANVDIPVKLSPSRKEYEI